MASTQKPAYQALVQENGSHILNDDSSSAPHLMNMAWFAASSCVCLGALAGAVACISSFELVDSLEMGYLFLFGAILATLDMPFASHIQLVPRTRISIGRYFHILTRLVGKSAVLTFLGCALFSSMWANLESMWLLVLAVVFGFFVVAVGVITGLIAVIKSVHLDKVRRHFLMDAEAIGDNALSKAYDEHAIVHPDQGMTPNEFSKMVSDARGIGFENSDLTFIFNTLSSSPKKDAVSLTDLHAWLQGSMVFL
jgi:hypothetical protein